MAIEMTIPVRWGDMDAFGHVNNTVFFRWFEDVRIQTFEAVGIQWEGPSALGPILATTHCDFFSPVHFPATVTLRCTMGRLGRTSFTMNYEASVEGKAVARGQGVVVLVDYATGDKKEIPRDLRARLEEHRTPSA